MKITEELLQKADQIPNFSDGVIMPDGDYRLIEEKGHLQTMMALLPYPEMFSRFYKGSGRKFEPFRSDAEAK